MAGFTALRSELGAFEFHIDNKNLAKRIRRANDNARVIVLQLDGDELDAALWGLENYNKNRGSRVVRETPMRKNAADVLVTSLTTELQLATLYAMPQRQFDKALDCGCDICRPFVVCDACHEQIKKSLCDKGDNLMREMERVLDNGVVEKRIYDNQDKLVEIRRIQPPQEAPAFKRIRRTPGAFGGHEY